MKRNIAILFTLIFSLSLCAQNRPPQGKPGPSESRRQKFKQEELQYIKEQNIMTDEQFGKFSEAYSEYREELWKASRNTAPSNKEMSDDQAKNSVNASVEKTMKNAELYKEYVGKLQGFMTDKEILDLQKAQEKFKKDKFKEIGRQRK